MKNIIFITVYLLLGSVVFSSCEDFFETTIELEEPEFGQNLVVQSITQTGEEFVFISVTKKLGILSTETSDNRYVNDALVELVVNGKSYFGQPTQQNYGPNYMILLDDTLRNGDILEITASKSGFETAKSTVKILPAVQSQKVSYFYDGGINGEGDRSSKVKLEFEDPIGPNYYEVTILANVYNDQLMPLYITSIEPSATESLSNSSLLFSDEGYDGQSKSIEFLFSQYYHEDNIKQLHLVWNNVSKEYFQFAKAYQLQVQSDDNPFATPVDIPTNITNGLGIFAAHSHQYIVIK